MALDGEASVAAAWSGALNMEGMEESPWRSWRAVEEFRV
jgi:hypothetical protein